MGCARLHAESPRARRPDRHRRRRQRPRAAAVGYCMTVGFVVNATKQSIRIHDLEGYVDNIRKWAGVEDEGNPGYGKISAKCFVRADADDDTLREIWRLAVEGSPVTQSVANQTSVETDFEMVG